MEVKAIGKYIHIGPQKARRTIDLIRGKDLEEALKILEFGRDKASRLIKKVVLSAAANAENNYNLRRENLYVSKAYVDQGPLVYSQRSIMSVSPRARGRVDTLRRRTSHITVILDERGT